MTRGDRADQRSAKEGKIPGGEKQCDIWTLARNELFCDDPPTYIQMPRFMREHWPDYAGNVRRLCVAAIQKRRTHRLYIQWLESEIGKLPKTATPMQGRPKQLTLPFAKLLNLLQTFG